MVDAKVVAYAAAGSLSDAHQRKVRYYNTQEIRAFVERETGSTPEFGTITCSWRGVLATETADLWSRLGLAKAGHKAIATHVVRASGRMHSSFHQISGGAQNQPG